MLNGSVELQEYIKSGKQFKSKANLTLQDNTTIELNPENFAYSDGFTIESATSNSNSFDVGAVIPKKLVIKILNYNGEYDMYDFEGAYVTNTEIFATLPIGNIENVKRGQYKVDKSVFKNGIITLTCYDKLAELDTAYSGVYTEQTALEFCQYIANKLGISLDYGDFNNSDMKFVIPNENYTDRQLLNYILQATCNYASININNQLVIKWYDINALDVADDLINAGSFTMPSTDIYDAGDFADMSDEQKVIDAGDFADISNRVIVETIFGSASLDVDNIVITGVVVRDVEGNEYVSGTKDYAIIIDNNPLIKGREQEVSKAVADIIVGMTFRAMSITSLNNPLIEAGDVGTVVVNNKPYATIFTNVTYAIDRNNKLICSAESPGKNSAVRNTEATKAYIQSKEYADNKIETSINSYDKAIQDLTTLMAQSFGVFKSAEKQADGSVIYYMHNKPNLSDSNIQWKMMADGMAVSTDGGKTWNAGIDASGNAVVNILSAVGINADWIKAGTINGDIYTTGSLNVMRWLDVTGGINVEADIYAENAIIFGQVSADNYARYIRLIPTGGEGIGYEYVNLETNEVVDRVNINENGIFCTSNWSGGFALTPHYLNVGGVSVGKDELKKLLKLI